MNALRTFVISLATAVLAACTSVPLAPSNIATQSKVFTPVPTAGVLYIYRNYKFAGAGLIYPIAVNGITVGSLKADTFIRVKVNPGAVQITSWSAAHQSALSLQIAAGEIKYVSTATHATGESFLMPNAGQVSIVEVPASIAQNDIQKLALVATQ